MNDPRTWYLGALVVILLLSLLLNKLGQCFVELVRIRHELEDANKMTRKRHAPITMVTR